MMKFKDGLQNITIFRQNIKLRGWLANYYILIFTKRENCLLDMQSDGHLLADTRFEQFARRHSGSVKLGHRTLWTGCSRLMREKILFLTSGAPEPQLGPPLSLSLTRGPHLSSSSSSYSPLLFFHC